MSGAQPPRPVSEGASSTPGPAHEDLLRRAREDRLLINRVDEWLVDLVRPWLGKRVLEVGCGWGNLALQLAPSAERWQAIDVDPESIEQLAALHLGSGLAAARIDICDPAVLALRDQGFDTVLSLNVLEHIERDQVALVNMRALLRPGGSLILVVPAHRWLYGSMDAAIGHLRRYTRRSMAELLAAADLTPVRLQYVNAIGALGWLVAGRVLHCEAPPPSLLRRFNALVPPLRWIESKISPPVGISLLVIAQ